MKSNQHKITKPPLQVADFICRRCRVQPTRNDDQVCGICKAIGQSVEPETVSWQEYFLAAKLTRPLALWFSEHKTKRVQTLEI
jgi:hypothetical protein